jgi:hypothetical protein
LQTAMATDGECIRVVRECFGPDSVPAVGGGPRRVGQSSTWRARARRGVRHGSRGATRGATPRDDGRNHGARSQRGYAARGSLPAGPSGSTGDLGRSECAGHAAARCIVRRGAMPAGVSVLPGPTRRAPGDEACAGPRWAGAPQPSGKGPLRTPSRCGRRWSGMRGPRKRRRCGKAATARTPRVSVISWRTQGSGTRALVLGPSRRVCPELRISCCDTSLPPQWRAQSRR